MHEIRLARLNDDRALTRAVLQISQMLGLYQAELARVLGLQCHDIGEFASARSQLQTDTPAWQLARSFVEMYEKLFRHFNGDAVAMYHWLRADQPGLAGTPLILMVDEGRLLDVLGWFEAVSQRQPWHAGKTHT